MSNNYFQFKQFTIFHDKCAMKVNSDSVLLGSWVNVNNAKRILDVGAGTGLLAIMMAQRTSDVLIDAVEIDSLACEQAKENIAKCPWSDRIILHHSSFQDFASQTSFKFDLIISNPPYFVNSLKSWQKGRTVARHSDSLPHSDLLKYSGQLLNRNGNFSVILPYNEGANLIAEAIKFDLFCCRKLYVRTNEKQDISRVLLEFKNFPDTSSEQTLITEASNPKQYSTEFKILTRDFYLKL